MSKKRKTGDYEVGFGRPPVEHQWKPGQSGNPRGRPRAEAPDIQAAFARALEQRVAVPVNGRTRKMPLVDVIALKTVTEAAKGNASARRDVLKFLPRVEKGRKAGWTVIDARPVFDEEENKYMKVFEENHRLEAEIAELKAQMARGSAPLLPPPTDASE